MHMNSFLLQFFYIFLKHAIKNALVHYIGLQQFNFRLLSMYVLHIIVRL